MTKDEIKGLTECVNALDEAAALAPIPRKGHALCQQAAITLRSALEAQASDGETTAASEAVPFDMEPPGVPANGRAQ